jgi:tripartite-type tricarboxylate transporter receptor subunit TctC
MTIVVPYAPGSSDQEARALAAHMERALAQPIQVENREGGGGSIGANFVRQAAPDGSTLLYAATAVLTVAPNMRRLPYSIGDLQGVARINAGPHLMAFGPSAKFTDMPSFIAFARANPDAVSFASPGPGSAIHLAGEALARAMRARLTHIPFQGAAPATAAAVGGNVDLVIGLPISIAPQIDAGTLKPLAIFSGQRQDTLPGVPTLKEHGVDLVLAPSFGFFAPTGVPRATVDALAAAALAAARTDEYGERNRRARGALWLDGPDEFQRQIAEENVFYRELLGAIGLRQN